jgi:large conductance mechanosensitive channel
MLKEFKEFAVKGNMLDLAVGMMIGVAFGAVTKSFVADIVTPLIGMAGGKGFLDMFIVLKEGATAGPYDTLALAKEAGAVTMNYGVLLDTILNLVLVAFVLFMVVKAFNKMKKKEEEKPAEPPKPSNEETLLTEIRDLLAKN